uniref:Uncharacterized protein n=2 Tax=Paramoeba aestuarina TaxID=180227 RepID=A0A7S4PIG4_9EUKA
MAVEEEERLAQVAERERRKKRKDKRLSSFLIPERSEKKKKGKSRRDESDPDMLHATESESINQSSDKDKELGRTTSAKRLTFTKRATSMVLHRKRSNRKLKEFDSEANDSGQPGREQQRSTSPRPILVDSFLHKEGEAERLQRKRSNQQLKFQKPKVPEEVIEWRREFNEKKRREEEEMYNSQPEDY